MHDRVSAIVSCYRGGKYLPQFLENYAQQSFFDRMDMIMDMNLPTAEELDIVRRFQNEHPGRLKVLTTDRLLTFGASWNRCMYAADGDLLTIWNIDDLRDSTSVERQASALAPGSDVDIVYGDYTMVKSFGSTEGEIVSYRDIQPEQYTRKFLLGPFFMFRRSLLDKAGMVDEQFRAAGDYDFGIRLAFHGRVGQVDGNLGHYLNTGTGLSTNPNTPGPVETAAIYLRYGVYDEIRFSLLPRTSPYNIYNALYGDKWNPISSMVPDYEAMLSRRYDRWFDVGALYHFTSSLRTEDLGCKRFVNLLAGRNRKNRGPNNAP